MTQNPPPQQTPLLDQLLTTLDQTQWITSLEYLREHQVQVDQLYSTQLPIPAQHLDILSELYHATQPKMGEPDWYQHLLEFVQKLPVCKLWLAYLPEADQIEELTATWRAYFEPTLILEVAFAPDLAAGFVCQFRGQQLDGSLDQLINKTLSDQSSTKQVN